MYQPCCRLKLLTMWPVIFHSIGNGASQVRSNSNLVSDTKTVSLLIWTNSQFFNVIPGFSQSSTSLLANCKLIFRVSLIVVMSPVWFWHSDGVQKRAFTTMIKKNMALLDHFLQINSVQESAFVLFSNFHNLANSFNLVSTKRMWDYIYLVFNSVFCTFLFCKNFSYRKLAFIMVHTCIYKLVSAYLEINTFSNEEIWHFLSRCIV